MAAPISEPVIGAVPGTAAPQAAYSVAPGDGANRVAQAGHAAAHHAEAGQAIEHGATAKKGKKVVEDGHIAKIIAEENESRSKFPRYPGLENWELLEKMGDGAFSNVYRARDRRGGGGEVAIKVVRKFEMNNMQVSYEKPIGGRAISSADLPFP
jgi:serine/threonine-protein kinase RCK2